MTSQIRFDPPGVAGLVASGTSLADAAERLGAPLELECGGKGECTSCVVRMKENPFALDEVTEAERQLLGEARIFEGVRLACQAHVRTGDCVVEILGPQAPEEEEQGESTGGDPRARVFEAFDELPTADQLSTAFELQVKVAGDLLGTLLEMPLKVGEQVLSSIFGAPPAASEPEKKEEAPPGKANGADEPHG